MLALMSGIVLVGGRTVEFKDAVAWLKDYFNENRNVLHSHPYAYPAYDRLQTGSGPDELNDGDLLAPGMLNASVTVRGFYSLQRVCGMLESGLELTGRAVTLSQAVDDGSLEPRMRSLVGVLDSEKLPGIRLTSLTKVLHRKRPGFMPLHDQFVRTCYYGKDNPVRPVRRRSNVDYFVAIASAIDADVRRQSVLLEKLRSEVGANVSLLRIIDVLAWKAGRL
jgi:hypothetical protein